MTYSPDEYKVALYRLLPRGPIWPTLDQNAPNWDALLDALAEEFGRVDLNEDELLDECYPDTCTDAGGGLPAWERVLSLPRACMAGISQTEDERRQAVLAALLGSRPVTLADFQLIADQFERNAVVSESGLADMFFVGSSQIGVDDYTSAAATTVVTITYDGPQYELLECTMRHALPVHLTATFEVV